MNELKIHNCLFTDSLYLVGYDNRVRLNVPGVICNLEGFDIKLLGDIILSDLNNC